MTPPNIGPTLIKLFANIVKNGPEMADEVSRELAKLSAAAHSAGKPSQYVYNCLWAIVDKFGSAARQLRGQA